MAQSTLAELASSPDAWAALVSLAALEIVLGVDNVIFLSILTAPLAGERGRNARRLGMLLAVTFRIGLLFALTSLLGLSATVFTAAGNAFSWRDLILIAGGLFLLAKATHELHQGAYVGAGAGPSAGQPAAAPGGGVPFLRVVTELIAVDLIFSIDSIITAIGMAQDVRIMIAAVLIAVAVMYAAAGATARFVALHPTARTLALAFLMLIGVALLADGFDFHIPRGYVYFAMAFAAAVEAFNIVTAGERRGPPSPGSSPQSSRPEASPLEASPPESPPSRPPLGQGPPP